MTLKQKKVLKCYTHQRPQNLRTDRKNQSGQFCTGLNSLQSVFTHRLFYLFLTQPHLQNEKLSLKEFDAFSNSYCVAISPPGWRSSALSIQHEILGNI